MIKNIYKTIIGASTTLGASTGFYCGCKIASSNVPDTLNLGPTDIIGESLCYSLIVVGNTMNGATFGCLGGIFFPLTSLGIYSLYSELNKAKLPKCDPKQEIKNINDETNKTLNLHKHPYNQTR